MTDAGASVPDAVERLRERLTLEGRPIDGGWAIDVYARDLRAILAALATAEQRAEDQRQKANHLWARYQTLEKAYYNCLGRADKAERERDEARAELAKHAVYPPHWRRQSTEAERDPI
jgi:multidrug resistance efflux pump